MHTEQKNLEIQVDIVGDQTVAQAKSSHMQEVTKKLENHGCGGSFLIEGKEYVGPIEGAGDRDDE